VLPSFPGARSMICQPELSVASKSTSPSDYFFILHSLTICFNLKHTTVYILCFIIYLLWKDTCMYVSTNWSKILPKLESPLSCIYSRITLLLQRILSRNVEGEIPKVTFLGEYWKILLLWLIFLGRINTVVKISHYNVWKSIKCNYYLMKSYCYWVEIIANIRNE
jgi:hypothetical protein